MDRRFFITALCAAPLVATGGTAFAQNAVVEAINVYLSNLTTVTAPFTQESADGSIVSGTFYLQKPGKMRFEYAPPSPALIIADGDILAVFDKKSTRGPQRYPQSSTPLSLLSRNNIDVTQSRFVRLIETRGGRIHVTLYDPEKPENGTMRLIFTQDPVELVEWVIVEKSGLESVVRLGQLSKNAELDHRLFNIPYAIRQIENGEL